MADYATSTSLLLDTVDCKHVTLFVPMYWVYLLSTFQQAFGGPCLLSKGNSVLVIATTAHRLSPRMHGHPPSGQCLCQQPPLRSLLSTTAFALSTQITGGKFSFIFISYTNRTHRHGRTDAHQTPASITTTTEPAVHRCNILINTNRNE